MKFAENYAALPDDIRAAIERDHPDEAQRLVHTLKGVAGNVGAQSVYQAAQELENAIREQRREVWQQYVQVLQQAMRQVCDSIMMLMSEQENQPESADFAEDATKTLDISVFRPIFMQLGQLLEQADTQAIHAADKLEPVCAQTSVQADVRELSVCIKRYRFEDALALWMTIARTLHID